MTRLYRGDERNVRHHVMNRGLARRTVFETRKDMRHFLPLLAKEVKNGRIRVLCFCLMSTHFHLFVESLTGELAQSMRQLLMTGEGDSGLPHLEGQSEGRGTGESDWVPYLVLK